MMVRGRNAILRLPFDAKMAKFAVRGMVDETRRVFGELRHHRLLPGTDSFNSIILAHILAGDRKTAARYLHEMRKRYINEDDTTRALTVK